MEKGEIHKNKIKFKNRCYCDPTEKNEKCKGKIYLKINKIMAQI